MLTLGTRVESKEDGLSAFLYWQLRTGQNCSAGELTACYQLFNVEGTGISRVKASFTMSVLCQVLLVVGEKIVPAIFPPFTLHRSLPGVLALVMALRLTLETWQGPEVLSCGFLSYGGGIYPRGFGCSSISRCCSWKTEQHALCLPEDQESSLNSQQAQASSRKSQDLENKKW